MASKQSTFNISLRLLTQQFTKGLNNVQKQLKSFGNFVKGTFAIASIIMFARKVVETGAQFEDAMARVQAVSNATAGEMAMMTKEAEKLGSTTKYTASEAAGALENLTRNGLSATQATQSLSATLQLAQANAIGLSEAANILTNTMNIFGLEVKDTNRINDVLSATCANSATNITDLSEAIKGVGPIATTMGKSIEETTAALGVLANRGVTGSEAGKALGAMFQRLAAQSPKAAAELKKYGLNIDETTLKTKTLDEILQMLADSGIGKSQAALDKIFGKNYSAKVGVLINGVEEFNKQLEITQNAAGTTARMFEQGVGSTENAIKSLQSAYEGLLNSIFKRTSGVLNGVLKALTDIVRALSNTKTRTVAIIGAVSSALTIKLVTAMNKVKAKALETKVAMTTLQAGITTVTAAAKAAYAAMGGWVGILMSIGTLIGTYLVNKFQKLNETAKEMADIERSYAAQTKAAANELERLHKIAEDENMTLSVRKKAIEEITRKVKDYHGEISKEGKLINDNKEAIQNYIKAIDAEMKIQAKQAALQTLYNKQAILETELLADAKIKASTGQKVEAGLMSIWMQMLSGNRVPSSAFYDTAVTDIYQRDILKQLNDVNEQIKKYTEGMNADEIARIISNLNNDNNDNNNNGPGSSKTDKDNPDKKLSKAQSDYVEALEKAALRFEKNITTQEEYLQEQASAYKSYIDAYIDYAASTGRYQALEGEEFKQLLAAYNELTAQTHGLALVRQKEKEKEDARKNTFEDLDKARSRYYAKESKSQVKSPWETFSSNPREYKAEERSVQELQTKLENLLSIYEGLKDKMKDIGEGKTDQERELLKFWEDLGEDIANVTEEYNKQAYALGKMKAEDIINDKTIEYQRDYYNSVRTTASAVGQLASNLESLSSGNWSTMSLVDKFNTLSNVIFGTIDSVISVMDAFKNLKETFAGLSLAKQEYQRIEDEATAKQIAAAEAVGAAELQKAGEIVAAAEMEAGATLALKEAQRVKVAANSSEAISGAASAMASIPYVGPALATAAATEMAALLAAILPKFANGGLIQGGSKYGDRLLARVNAGEMILNKQQQTRLFNIANGTGGIGGANVQFHIAGKDLVGVLRNNNSATSRISGSKGF